MPSRLTADRKRDIIGAGPKWAVGMGTEISRPSGVKCNSGSGGIEITLLTASAGHTMLGNRPIISMTHHISL